MRVAIVENTAVTHHGQVGVALSEAGCLTDVFRPFAGGALPDPAAYAGLVVFGGEQSAVEDSVHGYLPELARRMAESASAGGPVLGICLGAQLLARGLGAENLIGAAREFGWREVELTAAGRDDPVLGTVAPRFRSFQWHTDSFAAPPGAVHLARSGDAEQQAFRAGARAWGTQFHFEANRAVVSDWTRRFPAMVEAIAPGWVKAHDVEAAHHGAASDAAGLALARAWVAQL